MKNIIVYFVVFYSISVPMMAKTIQIDSIFTSSGEIFPFGEIGMISGISLNGSVELNNDTSLVRVILKDRYGVQYMIFETYPLISQVRDYYFSDTCDETCFLDQIRPYSIIIQVIDANIHLTSYTYSDDTKKTWKNNVLKQNALRMLIKLKR
jgi:hypothetical protein